MLPGPASQTCADEAMRPVPRYSGSGLKDSRPDTQRSTTPGLQWRTSNRVAPAKTKRLALSLH